MTQNAYNLKYKIKRHPKKTCDKPRRQSQVLGHRDRIAHTFKTSWQNKKHLEQENALRRVKQLLDMNWFGKKYIVY